MKLPDPSSIVRRLDSWTNALTGLGNALRDKAANTVFAYNSFLDYETCEALYHGEDIAARICDALPESALRQGFYLSAEDTDTDLSSALSEYHKKLKFRKALAEAAIWSRVYGGAVILLGIDDGRTQDQPVNEANIRSIRYATVLDKEAIYPVTYYQDVDRFQEPELYEIKTTEPLKSSGSLGLIQPQTRIHESRLLRLDGARTSARRKALNQGWSDSVLTKVHDVIRDFGTSWQAVGHLMNDAHQGVFRIKGLVDMISSNDKEELNTRMQLVDMSRSVARAIMLDAEQESFERQSVNFAGIPDILRMFMIRVSAAAKMPVAVLMGRDAAPGLNAAGDADVRLWYDTIKTYQEDHLLDPIERMYRLIFLARDFAGTEPDSWEVRFGRLWQMSDKEQAELEKLVADRDHIYYQDGVLLAEEIAVNRFKARGFSADTQIDLEARQEMLEAELELAKEQAGEPEPGPLDIIEAQNKAKAGMEEDEKAAPRQDSVRNDTVQKRGSEWVILSKSGRVLEKGFTSEEGAKKRLQQIEFFKRHRK